MADISEKITKIILNNSAEKFRQVLFFESTEKKKTRKTLQNTIQNQILIKSYRIFRFGIKKLTAEVVLFKFNAPTFSFVQAKIFPMIKAKFAHSYYRAETIPEVN